MDDEERKMLDEHTKMMKKLFKAALYTFIVTIFSLSVIGFLLSLVFNSSNDLLDFFMGIVFTIIYCTLTIVEEIRKK